MADKQLTAPNRQAILAAVKKEKPGWTFDAQYKEALVRHAEEMNKYSSAVVARMKADPAMQASVKLQLAEREARREMRPEPDHAVLMHRERHKLTREGWSEEDIVKIATENVNEVIRVWRTELHDRTKIITARDASVPITFAAPKPPKPEQPIHYYVPDGMNRETAINFSARGLLPRLKKDPPYQAQNAAVQLRVQELRAKGGEFADYTAAFIEARRQIAEEENGT